MARGIALVLLVALTCLVGAGVVWAVPSSVRQDPATTGQTDERDGVPPGVIEFQGLAGGDTDAVPDGPLLLRLERLDLAPGAASTPRAVAGVEALAVDAGEVAIADAFGVRAALATGDGLVLRPGLAYEVRNDATAPASLLRLVVAPTLGVPAEEASWANAPSLLASTPVAGPSTTVLWQQVVPALPGRPATVWLARARWGAGSRAPRGPELGPAGLLVEKGVLTIDGPPGLQDRLPAGHGIVIPAQTRIETINTGDEPVVALLFGVAAEDDPIASGPPPGPAGAGGALTVAAVDIAWEHEGQRSAPDRPVVVEVAPGDTLSLPNNGAAPHNFVVESLDNVVVDLPIGQTATYTMPADAAPGEYEFICTLPGHRQAGQVGILVVG